MMVEEYENRYGSRQTATRALALGLMRGDAATFKAGYTAENAVLAVRDLYGYTDEALTDDEVDDLRRFLAAFGSTIT